MFPKKSAGRTSGVIRTPQKSSQMACNRHRCQPRELQSLEFVRPEEMDARSFHLEAWQREGLQYFAIGDLSPEDLHALGQLLRK